MTEPRPQFDAATEEQASLYTLRLLSDEEQRGFERQLAQDPALREFVRELQGNLEAEVFNEPATPAPLEVWGRISAQTQASDGALLRFPAPVVRWVWRGLAAAACLALGAGLHAWWSGRNSTVVAQQPPGSTATGRTPAVGPRTVTTAPTGADRNSAAEPAPPPVVPLPTASAVLTNPAAETALLQRRVRSLASQVAALSQTLTQRTALPSGASRLHVFRLGTAGDTNAFGAAFQPEGAIRPQRLAEALIRQTAAPWTTATQFPEVNAPTNHAPVEIAGAGSPAEPVVPPIAIVPVTPATPGASGVADGAIAETPVEPAAVSPSVTLATLNPIVLFDPATGEGAVALSIAGTGSMATGRIQLWNQNSDGTFSSIGVIDSIAGSDTIATFNIPADGNFNAPALSFEPPGGSIQPTGPIFGGLGNTNAPVGSP